jgi:hypothetical protein
MLVQGGGEGKEETHSKHPQSRLRSGSKTGSTSGGTDEVKVGSVGEDALRQGAKSVR